MDRTLLNKHTKFWRKCFQALPRNHILGVGLFLAAPCRLSVTPHRNWSIHKLTKSVLLP